MNDVALPAACNCKGYSASGVCSGQVGPITATQIMDSMNKPQPPTQPDPEVIMEIEGWRMEEPSPLEIGWLFNSCTMLSHICKKTHWRQWATADQILNYGVCGECGEDIPEGVIAVWTMYNDAEISKAKAEIREMNKTYTQPEYDFVSEIYPDSSEVCFTDVDPYIYNEAGEIINDQEISEWNGIPEEDEIVLFSASGNPLQDNEPQTRPEVESISGY
jgi:hypothetical protein